MVNVLSAHRGQWTIAVRMWATLLQELPPLPSSPHRRTYVTRVPTVCPLLLAELSTSSWFGAACPEGHYEQAHSWKQIASVSFSTLTGQCHYHQTGCGAHTAVATVLAASSTRWWTLELRSEGLLTSAVERCYRLQASATLPVPVIKELWKTDLGSSDFQIRSLGFASDFLCKSPGNVLVLQWPRRFRFL